MDSAIAPHIRCPRSLPLHCKDDYVPFRPGGAARFDPKVQRVVMCYQGVQYRDEAGEKVARAGIQRIVHAAGAASGPAHHDIAQYIDEVGYKTLIVISYWDDEARFHDWLTERDIYEWWNDPEREVEGVGWFREVVLPHVTRFETTFSSADQLEGVGRLGTLSGPIQERGYWGSMRDRLPIGQTDPVHGTGEVSSVLSGRRLRIVGGENLALIRSGQDWSLTEGDERATYLNEVFPVLRKGMDFLRDHGREIGCFANRHMTHVDSNFEPIEKTFGMSWWRSLKHLETWAQTHPTHLAIYGMFIELYKAMNFKLSLRLYHEVTVVPMANQYFEYVSCHPSTGMVRALEAAAPN